MHFAHTSIPTEHLFVIIHSYAKKLPVRYELSIQLSPLGVGKATHLDSKKTWLILARPENHLHGVQTTFVS